MQNSIRFSFLAGILVLAMSGLNQTAEAGNGSFKSGEYEFCVSVRFKATAAQISAIQSAFQRGSQILEDATDGQHRFGTIRVVNNSGASDTSEYWVNSGSGRAYATAGDYGKRGQHVMLFMASDFGAGPGAAYTVAHEHAHHSWGVLDEYSGPSGPSAECSPGPDTAALDFCLMDNFFTRGGNAVGSGFTLNEFCVAGNHDPDADTFQESANGESCWETIGSHPTRSATAPTGTPTAASPASTPVTFQTGFGGLRVVMVLDRSGSMAVQNRMTFAKRGANTFLSFLEKGDEVGVTSFSCSTRADFPLTTITGSGTSAARSAVDALSPGGGTNIGGGLQTALNQLTSQADRSCNEIIVLLSDGDHNCGLAPNAVIPALQEEAVTVLTVGVGSGISATGQANLQRVASATGGSFSRVSNSFGLVALFLRLSFESVGGDLLARVPLDMASGDSIEIPVLVEPGVDRATFALAFENTAADLDVDLRSPSGMVFDSLENTVEEIVDVNMRAFRVTSPESGVWSVLVDVGSVNPGQLEFLSFAEHPGTQLNVTVVDDDVEFPEPVVLRATPRFQGEAVVGALVEGTVLRPDGSTVSITLVDDGQHNDGMADDGVYGATFSQYSDDGTYSFELVAQSVGGSTFSGEDVFIDAGNPSNARPVPDFVRIGTATAIVTAVPDFIVATVEIGPETINLKSRGRFVTAYLELPRGFAPEDIRVSTVSITAVDGLPIAPITARAKPTEIADFDNDGIGDLMVKFNRDAIQKVLSPSMRTLRIEGFASNILFVGERAVAVIDPGK